MGMGGLRFHTAFYLLAPPLFGICARRRIVNAMNHFRRSITLVISTVQLLFKTLNYLRHV